MTPLPGVPARFFTFRAECPIEVLALTQMLGLACDVPDEIDVHPGPPDPVTGVIDVELCVPGTITREVLLASMQTVPDSHLMQQTLRELVPAASPLEPDGPQPAGTPGDPPSSNAM
ncbi:hypothetical protein H8N03_01050 [Ramlibacter sp. USB13]|uniref:Uncharacterized protein n=1 Tax=Ramlibacter cellulosilyticus TaxID=2764187 RepID=A0A923S991_9BURK|nr:hypothetical protein [Ramlibacter cellulosilyticus]MBC5781509.1 hypothetical protein [Ramlibacter cellulosilyticus]